MLRSRRVSVLLAGLILCLGLAVMVRLDAEASTKKEYFDSLSVGISQIVDPTVEAVDQKAIEELTQISEANASQEEEESDFCTEEESLLTDAVSFCRLIRNTGLLSFTVAIPAYVLYPSRTTRME